jgi:Flp pilus assembly CpaF family ATPase
MDDAVTRQRAREAFDAYVEPIAELLASDSVAEIMLNPAVHPEAHGRVWIDVEGKGIVDSGVTLSATKTEMIMRNFADQATGEHEFNERHPVLSCQAAMGQYRFEGLIPPAAKTPTFTIRKYLKRNVSLVDYVDAGTLTLGECNALAHAARSGETIVLGGQTFSGKTTMLNALLSEASRFGTRRLLIIEDTPELDCPTGPSLRLEVRPGSEFGYQQAVWSSLRQRPDAIVLGEIRRPGDAMEAVEAWNTGHQGFGTVHAPSCTRMLHRLYSLCRQSQNGQHVTQDTITDAVQIVVHLKRVDGRRVIDAQRVIGWDAVTGFQTKGICDVED